MTPRARKGQYCEDCGTRPKHVRHIRWFKGRFRCNLCELRASQSIMPVYSQQVRPTSNGSTGFKSPQCPKDTLLPALNPADTNTLPVVDKDLEKKIKEAVE